jgi:hypothetical protein
MTNRTATDTIKGYFYQFDLSILTLLELKDENHKITVEGIEDIDVNKATEENAIQCKYHSKTEYNHSVIAKPIRLMLNHFRGVLDSNQQKVKYTYYGHFKSGHSKLTLPITLDFLKKHLLTYKKNGIKYRHHIELKLNDKKLLEFLSQLQINIQAKSYEDQLLDIHNLLKSQNTFVSDDFEAENYFYNNALKVISNLAIKEAKHDRIISKKEFLKEINSKKILFHKWFTEFKGKKKIFSELRNRFFTNYNISPFERFFLIEIKPSDYSKSELKDVIHLISKKWSDIKSSRNPDTFCPYIFIKGIKKTELINLKKELFDESFKFKDGFDYNGASFNLKSIKEKATFHNKINIKIINDLKSVNLLLSNISETKEVYQFFLTKPFFSTTNSSVKVVNIQLEELNNIKNII